MSVPHAIGNAFLNRGRLERSPAALPSPKVLSVK
jgi:hypothetical protein